MLFVRDSYESRLRVEPLKSESRSTHARITLHSIKPILRVFRYIDIFLLLISVLFGCYTQGSVPATMYGVMVARQTLVCRWRFESAYIDLNLYFRIMERITSANVFKAFDGTIYYIKKREGVWHL